MSDLSTVALHVRSFYRLMGVKSGDASLTRRGEDTDEIAYYHLTRGTRAAQRWLLDNGYKDWLARSSALSFSGTDAADGGKYADLPTNFLKANGDERRSCLVEANGDRWGRQVDERDDERKGDYFYFSGRRLWLARTASPPATLYLQYHYMHPAWAVDLDPIDFPLEARPLIVAEAANLAKEESWVPGGNELKQNVARALSLAQSDVRSLARYSKEPRKIRSTRRASNRY